MTAAGTSRMDSAVSDLLQGYAEELRLYERIRTLTLWQGEALRARGDVARFSDLMDEKEDLLRLIGQIEFRLAPARQTVTEHAGKGFPRSIALAAVLDRLTALLGEIRAMESAHAILLDALGAQDSAPTPAAVPVGA